MRRPPIGGYISKNKVVMRNSLTAQASPDFQLGPFFETDLARTRDFYRIFSHKGDYFTLRPSCQASPFVRIKCVFIRHVDASGTPPTNINQLICLPQISLIFKLMVNLNSGPEHSLIKARQTRHLSGFGP